MMPHPSLNVEVEMTLAVDGGKPAVSAPLRIYNSIGQEEVAAAIATIKRGPLSGFMGGERHGGLMVQALEQQMCEMFGSKYAVACNSCTSGLLIASMACGVGRDTVVQVPSLTMSATAAAPAFLGAKLSFADVEAKTFAATDGVYPPKGSTIILTNLFGHPGPLQTARAICGSHHSGGRYLIEDNAQGWLAREGKKYAGTVGHIGVFSFNVHKHVQSGEGGVCLTDSSELAERMAMSRNHGELAGGPVGLNLRMTEVEAAIALSQLNKVKRLVEGRRELAEFLTECVVNYPGLIPPLVREDCDHAYYIWALTVERERQWFVRAIRAEGVPMNYGYVEPLYRLPAFSKYKAHCPTAEWLHDVALCTFEVCAYDPSAKQKREIRTAFDKVGEAYVKRIRSAALDELVEHDQKIGLYP
jgi:perosamine synthetase